MLGGFVSITFAIAALATTRARHCVREGAGVTLKDNLKMETLMLVVTGTIDVNDGDVEKLKPIVAKMAAASRAEEGCISYAFYQDLEEPNRVRVYEEWVNQDALSAHFQTPHMAEFNRSLGDVKFQNMDIKKFEPGEMKPVM